MLRQAAALALLAFMPSLDAHTVPTVVVEAEFSPQREVVLKVNLDPRLFLSPQPTSLPPVPASWWFDQDETARAQTVAATQRYVDDHLTFHVGNTALAGTWSVQPIDSVSAFPLGEASAEVHLLAERRGPLPAVPGDFKINVAKGCAVPVILLNSLTTDENRRPQSLFPGESSRGFPLPALEAKVVTKPQDGWVPPLTVLEVSFILLLAAGLWFTRRMLRRLRAKALRGDGPFHQS
jgi:hypothetical protein